MKGLPEDDESRMAAAGNLAERRIERAGPPKAVWQPVSRQPAWRRVQQVSAVVVRQRSAPAVGAAAPMQPSVHQ